VPADVRAAIKEQPWRGGLEPCGDVNYTLDATCIEGKLPASLNGTLYRCGPGRIRVGKHRYAHWFDGDGAMTSFTFDRGTVRVASRLVETPRVQAQRAQGDDDAGFAVRGAWTQATSAWRNLFAIPTNPSNTSALVWANKLLALCEGGSPMELDRATLQTRGPAPFGRDPTLLGFGAHFKIDPTSNVLYNCGLQLPGALRIFSIAPDGRELASTSVSFGNGEVAFVHDWAMSADHMIFFIPPWVCKPLDMLRSVAGLGALGHAFRWQAGRGTRCLVLRKRDFSVVLDTEVDAFSTYHFANAWEEGSLLKVHVNRLNGDRADLEARFSDMYAASFAHEHYNTLWEYTIDLAAGKVIKAAPAMPPASGALPMEYTVVSHRKTGQQNRYVYTTAYSGDGTFFDALQKYDLQAGTAQTRRCPVGEHPSEVAFVPSGTRDDDAPEDAGFLLFVAYVAATHSSKLYVLDAADFEGKPLAVCSLPTHAPYSFHGWFEKA
jgi:all-trans-8'-apo-beta-carotenal 15,15'-oxygenase